MFKTAGKIHENQEEVIQDQMYKDYCSHLHNPRYDQRHMLPILAFLISGGFSVPSLRSLREINHRSFIENQDHQYYKKILVEERKDVNL